MLRKLIKHEFRATGQVMLPVFGVLLVTALGANLSFRYLLNGGMWFLTLLGSLLMMAFSLAILGVFVVAFVLMIQRFYKNLLQDEGYVMLTLPVSIHQHIWAKLVVSAVWFTATILAVILAGCISAFNIVFISDFFQTLGQLLRELWHLRPYYAFNGAALLTETAVLVFLALVAFSLQFYAALAAGHSFPNHKMALSVLCFFILQFIMQLLSVSGLMGLDRIDFFHLVDWQLHGMTAMHAGVLVMIFLVVIYGGIFYAITVFFMKKHLNLE